MISHRAPISGIASHAGQYVATAGYDNQVILWDPATKDALARGMHDHLVNQCEFSPDGKLLATSSSDYSARLWDVPSMRLRATLMGAQDDVEAIAFHPNEPKVATSSRDGVIRVYDFEGRMALSLRGHTADVISVSWTRNGAELVSSSDDGTVRRWCAQSGSQLQVFDFGGVETDTIAVVDDKVVIAGNDDGQLIVIEGERRTTYEAHEAGVKRVVYDRATGNIVSLSYDRRAMFWRLSGGELAKFSEASLPDVVWPRSCTFVNESEVAFVSFGCTYVGYDYRNCAWELEKVDPTHGINAAVVARGQVYTVGDAGQVRNAGELVAELGSLCNFIAGFGARLVAGGQLGRVIDALTGETYYQHRSPLNCAVAFGEGAERRLAVGTYTGEVLVFGLENEVPRYLRTVSLHANAIKGLAWSENLLFSVCADSGMAIHDTRHWTCVRREEDAHGKIANGCAALSAGEFVSVSRDLKLRIWRAEQTEVVDTPHGNSIKCCAVSAQASLVATGDYTGHVAVYSLPLRRYVYCTRLTAAGISSLLADESGTGFLATSYDGSVYRVDISALDGAGQ